MSMRTANNAHHVPQPTGYMTALATGLMAADCAINGVWMLADPPSWFAAAPGASDAGPLNGHFVQDVGIAFITCALAYALALIRPAHRRPLLAIPAVFLGLHGGLHLADGLAHGSVIDWAAMSATIGPGLIAIVLAVLASASQPDR